MRPLATLLALAAPFLARGAALPCEDLLKLALPHTTITTAEVRPAGDFTPPGAAKPIAKIPAFCRVAGSSKPSADSDIRFEVWLPASHWNGKFHGIGNGGYAGAISFDGLADAVRHSYATASTDTGHQDDGLSARWALQHPEKIIDFGYRAIHETALAAKLIIAAFYGQAPTKSYFDSCSNGGRQALMEAQRFPEDYDGIVAGAPANDWTNLMTSAAADAKAMLAESASYIPAAKLPAIEAAALAQCDARDAVKDGVIENPAACPFDPSALLCQGAETNACLTVQQLSALKAVYGGLTSGKGKQIFPGYSAGGEAEPGGWGAWITGDAPEKSLMFVFGTQFFKNMVYSNPDWQFRAFNADSDGPAAEQRMGRYLNATNPDLSAFEKRGGKLILFHGWSDAAIPALNSIHYYDTVVAKMGAQRASNFVRLYMVPGMQHCGGGAGPDDFGQGRTPEGDRFHSVDTALEAWVEQGAAPASLIAAKHRQGAADKTRPLCAWPATAKYKGAGSTDDAADFLCQ